MSDSARLKGEATSPKHTLELVKEIGVTKAARQLGVSTTTLHKARREGEVSRVIEVAATGLVAHEKGAAKPHYATKDHAVFLLDIPVDKQEVFKRFADAIGAEYLAA